MSLPLPSLHARQLSWLALCVLALQLSACAVQQLDAGPAERHRLAAERIRATYEAVLPELSGGKRRHYAQRLYRVSGEERYLPANREYMLHLAGRLEAEIAELAVPGQIERLARESVEGYPRRTAKQRARAEMFSRWGEFAYAKGLLFRLVQAHCHGMLDEVPGHERALDYLEDLPWEAFLTDPEVLEVYAAQVANQVHFLHQLGVMDLRREVEAVFRRRYPPDTLALLSTAEYRNWLYGLTHFIIAASRYYQQKVDDEEYAWILEAFSEQSERIMRDATEDIQAEVALSFLLAGQEEHPLVRQIRDLLAAAVEPASGMIPSPDRSTNLEEGEHRNVLAIMVLGWQGRLYPGPAWPAL
ncbi:DUF3541 domain-containing protein [Halomonas icarae]|uniref:DUF3541 domain-containing protein n=1 Tax=Halomonas icarae TaxID=2691040 RepID=A0A7X4VYG8_9GAMM|nr:DUF3541 domain-containing protein [Halomonas icarae]MDR5901833.1 DUF3541 domain-containing protein [Halomonas icarae]NAW12669.1 DUF3541 domain-containing protein [Halomonas icarae]